MGNSDSALNAAVYKAKYEELQRCESRLQEAEEVARKQREYERTVDQRIYEEQINHLRNQLKTSDDRFAYFKKKPQKDIAVPENMEETIRKAKADLKLDTVNFFNFAFVGHTKTGKSSLINAIRGVEDDDADAAKVGVTETTHEIAPYMSPDPKFKHIRFYDIPGSGTLTHNAKSYYHDKCLCAFDCLIICAQDTLGQEEIDFAVQSLRYNQPIVFVRSRCDIVLDNAKKQKKIKTVDQNAASLYIDQLDASYIEEIKRVRKEELYRIPCFFVSAYSLRDFVQGVMPEILYQESNLVEYIISKSKYSRNITA